MILLSDAFAYGEQLKATVTGVNFFDAILDLSEITNGIGERKKADNSLLYLVIPEAVGNGSSEDNMRNLTTLDFVVCDKTEYTRGQSKYIQTFVDTQLVAIALGKQIIEDASGTCHEWLMHLDYTKYSIMPMNNESGVNGWMVSFAVKSYL